jgi:hypothetical protein
MKIKAICEGSLAAIVSAIFLYSALISPVTVSALHMRKTMPDAWFSSSVTWYALFAVLVLSITVASIVFRMVYRHSMRAATNRTF